MKHRRGPARRLASRFAALYIYVGLGLCACLVVRVAAAAEARPILTALDVRNGADYSSGGVAAGEVVVLFSSDAGPFEIVPWGLEGNLKETISIGETRVLFDDVAVPIVYTVRGRISTFVPYSVAGRETTTVVVEYQGRRSPAVTLNVVPSAPAIFTLDATGKGRAAMLNETGCCNSVRNPAVLGTIVSLYATGEGKLEPGSIEKEVFVTVGGMPAPITFAQNFKAFQVNFRVPADAPVGDAIPLVLTVRGRQSSPDVTMALRSPRQRVLLVHPSAAIRSALGRILEGNGYQVIAAREFEEIGVQSAHRLALLILDVEAPKDKALEMLARIRETNPQLRIMVIAADLNPQALKKADLLGAQSVLMKPLNADKVLTSVRTLLRKRPAVY